MIQADFARRPSFRSSLTRRPPLADYSVKTPRMLGALTGGLVAGLGLTAMLMTDEKKTGKPSELVDIERAGAQKLGLAVPPADSLPNSAEQSVVQAGHLLISLAAGGAYALTVKDSARVVPSGVVFGLGLYAALHWLTGPALGLKQPEWQSDAKTIGKHTLIHVLFGLTTAAGAKAATRLAARR